MQKKIYFRKNNGQGPGSSAYTKVCITNHIVEIKTFQKYPHNLRRFKRISKTEYLDLGTGEIREYRENSGNTVRNTNASFDYLRRLINQNFTGQLCELHVILTYGEQISEKKQLSNCFRHFWSRFRYRHPGCEYIAIAEPHATGMWHMHVLVKNSHVKRFYVSRAEISKCWQHGNVWVGRLSGNDNIGAYFTALKRRYVVGEAENREDNQKSRKKDRLPLYPRFGKIFTASRGIQRPKTLTMSYSEAMRLVGNAVPCFSEEIAISTSNETGEEELNTLYYQQFNLKRK